MSHSEIPPPPETNPGHDLPELRVRPPGPESRSWNLRHAKRQAPMGPRRPAVSESVAAASGPIVLSRGLGSNLLDVDMNRYVDLAAGFGAILLGHQHPAIQRALDIQSARLFQALGDVFPSDAKIGFLERLAQLAPFPEAQIILGQSGADAISAALKTAVLATGRAGVLAFQGSYHGLSYAPLSVSDLRESYRAPFQKQLGEHAQFLRYPTSAEEAEAVLNEAKQLLSQKEIGAVLIEPILGRGGVHVPPPGFLSELRRLTEESQTLLIFDEIWTALGRAGAWFLCEQEQVLPDLLCLGKGLGGGLPLSACLGRSSLMQHWSQEQEVVHTSTFAGAPLACTTALATIDVLSRSRLIERARTVGEKWKAQLSEQLEGTVIREVRGQGLMIGLDASAVRGGASALQRLLLERGYVTSTGGGARDVLVLTPALTISEAQLEAFTECLTWILPQLRSH